MKHEKMNGKCQTPFVQKDLGLRYRHFSPGNYFTAGTAKSSRTGEQPEDVSVCFIKTPKPRTNVESAISTNDRENHELGESERVSELTNLHAVVCIEAGVHWQGLELGPGQVSSHVQALVYSSENGMHLRRWQSIVLSK